MVTFRSDEVEEQYRQYRETWNHDASATCVLCEKEAVKTFEHWKIVENLFPYDLVAKTHHMIVPLQHQAEVELSLAARAEFDRIKHNYLHTSYDYLMESTYGTKTIPEHFHLHLIIAPDTELGQTTDTTT